MDKQSLLKEVANFARLGAVTQEDLQRAFRDGSAGQPHTMAERVRFTDILYYLGGFIIFLGIVILMNQNWESLNSATRILIALGSGIAAYVMAVLFQQHDNTIKISNAFFFLSAILLPLGIFVTFHEAGFSLDDSGIHTILSGILFATYLASFFQMKRTLFLFFSIVFGTWLLFAFTSFLLNNGPIDLGWRFYAYRILLTGLSYILLGHAFRGKALSGDLTGFLFAVGIIGFLGAALSLGGWTPEQSIIWELVFPGIVFGVMFLSIPLKSRSFLFVGAFYLMAYLIKITSEYFSKGLGWPLALIVVGFSIIGVGYYAFHLNKKFLAK